MKKPITYILSAIIAMIFISCEKEVNASTINLDHTAIHIPINVPTTIVATITPDNAKNKIVKWTSDNTSIVTVDSNGTLIGYKQGTTTVTATVVDSNIEAKCEVSVGTKPVEYELVWSDEFDGTSLNQNNWNIEVNDTGGGNNELQYYTNRSENIRVENGLLIIEAKKEQYLTRNYTSARITTQGKKDFTYGFFKARIKVPSGAGTWPAFWTLGSNIKTVSWPRCGEIDIMEHVGSTPNQTIHAIHTSEGNGTNGRHWVKYIHQENLEGEFHEYGMEWIEKEDGIYDLIRFYIDGVKTSERYQGKLNDTAHWPFNNPQFIILNLAIGGTLGGTVDNNIFNNPIKMEIDWVKVYQDKK